MRIIFPSSLTFSSPFPPPQPWSYRLILSLLLFLTTVSSQNYQTSSSSTSTPSSVSTSAFSAAQSTTFDGITYDKAVSYIKFNGKIGVTLDLADDVLGTSINTPLNYTLMFWMKLTDPVGQNPSLMQIFKFNSSLGCYVAMSKNIICESNAVSEKLITSTTQIFQNQWFHFTVAGMAQSKSYLSLESNKKNEVIDSDYGAYMALKQYSKQWGIELGYTANMYYYTGGIREFILISTYLTQSQTINAKNFYFAWDQQILAYYRFASNSQRQVYQDEFRAQFGAIISSQSLSFYQHFDFISNDVCFPFFNQTSLLKINQDYLFNSIRLPPTVVLDPINYGYTLQMWLNINQGSCATLQGQNQPQNCNLFSLSGVLLAYLSTYNGLVFSVQARVGAQQVTSDEIFVPLSQWVNVQFNAQKISGFQVRTFDQNGRQMGTYSYQGVMPVQQPGSDVALFANYRGYVKNIAFFNTYMQIPISFTSSYTQNKNLILYYDFQAANVQNNQVINLAQLSAVSAIQLKVSPTTQYVVWPNPQINTNQGSITSSLQTPIPIQDLYDGVACNNTFPVINLQSPTSYLMSNILSSGDAITQMTLEFWFKISSPSITNGFIFQMASLITKNNYFSVQINQNQLTCTPLGNSYNQPLYYNATIKSQQWIHFFCQFQTDILFNGGVFSGRETNIYSLNINDTNGLWIPTGTYSIYLGNSMILNNGITNLNIKEFRMWQTYRSLMDIQYYRNNKIEINSELVGVLLSYIRLSGIMYAEQNMMSFLNTTISQNVFMNGIGYIQDPTLIICPPYTYYINDACYQDIVTQTEIQVFPVKFTDGLRYLFTFNPAQLIGSYNSIYFLNFYWSFDDDLLNSLTIFDRNSSNLLVHSNQFVDESKIKVSLTITNEQNTFYFQTSINYIPQKCSYFKVKDSKNSDSYSSYKGTTRKQGAKDILFTLTYVDLQCTTSQYYDTLSQYINYTVFPNQWATADIPVLTFNFVNSGSQARRLDTQTQEIQVTIGASEQHKFDSDTDYYFSLALNKKKSDSDNSIDPLQNHFQNVQHTINFGDSDSNDYNQYFQDILQMYEYKGLQKDENIVIDQDTLDDESMTIDSDMDNVDTSTIGESAQEEINGIVKDGNIIIKLNNTITPIQVNQNDPLLWVGVSQNSKGQWLNKYNLTINIVDPINTNQVLGGYSPDEFIDGSLIGKYVVPPISANQILGGYSPVDYIPQQVVVPNPGREPPYGGYAIFSPTKGYSNVTQFYLSLSNWRSLSPPLSYKLYQVIDSFKDDSDDSQDIDNYDPKQLKLITTGSYTNNTKVTFKVKNANQTGPTYFVIAMIDACCQTYLEFYAQVYDQQAGQISVQDNSFELGAASLSPTEGKTALTQFTATLSNWGSKQLYYKLFQVSDYPKYNLYYLASGPFTTDVNIGFFTNFTASTSTKTSFIIQVSNTTSQIRQFTLSATITYNTDVHNVIQNNANQNGLTVNKPSTTISNNLPSTQKTAAPVPPVNTIKSQPSIPASASTTTKQTTPQSTPAVPPSTQNSNQQKVQPVPVPVSSPPSVIYPVLVPVTKQTTPQSTSTVPPSVQSSSSQKAQSFPASTPVLVPTSVPATKQATTFSIPQASSNKQQVLQGKAIINPTKGYTSSTLFNIVLTNWISQYQPFTYQVYQVQQQVPIKLNPIASGNFFDNENIPFYLSVANKTGLTYFLVNITDTQNNLQTITLSAQVSDLDQNQQNSFNQLSVSGTNTKKKSGMNLLQSTTEKDVPIQTQVVIIQNTENQVKKQEKIVTLSLQLRNLEINQISNTVYNEIIFAKEVLIEQIQLSLQNVSSQGGNLMACLNNSLYSIEFLTSTGNNLNDEILNDVQGIINFILQPDYLTLHGILSQQEVQKNILQIISSAIRKQEEEIQQNGTKDLFEMQSLSSYNQIQLYMDSLCEILNEDEQLLVDSTQQTIIVTQIAQEAGINQIYQIINKDSILQFQKSNIIDSYFLNKNLCLQTIYLKNKTMDIQNLQQQQDYLIESTLIDIQSRTQAQFQMGFLFKLKSSGTYLSSSHQCLQKIEKFQNITERLNQQIPTSILTAYDYSPCISILDEVNSQLECACLFKKGHQYIGVFLNHSLYRNQSFIKFDLSQKEFESSFVLYWQFIPLALFIVISIFVTKRFDVVDKQKSENQITNIHLSRFITYAHEHYDVSLKEYWKNKHNQILGLMLESQTTFRVLSQETHPIQSIFTKFDTHNSRIQRLSFLTVKLSMFSSICILLFGLKDWQNQLDYQELVLDSTNLQYIIFVSLTSIPIISLLSFILDKLFTRSPIFSKSNQTTSRDVKSMETARAQANIVIQDIEIQEKNKVKEIIDIKDVICIIVISLSLAQNLAITLIFSKIHVSKQVCSIFSYLLGLFFYSFITANLYLLVASMFSEYTRLKYKVIFCRDVQEIFELFRILKDFQEDINRQRSRSDINDQLNETVMNHQIENEQMTKLNFRTKEAAATNCNVFSENHVSSVQRLVQIKKLSQFKDQFRIEHLRTR